MSRSSFRYIVIASAIISSNLLFSPIEAFSKPRPEIIPCESVTLPFVILTRQARNECGDRKLRPLNVRSNGEGKSGSINDGPSSGGGSSGGGSSGGGSSGGGSSGGGSSGGGSSGGGGTEPPLPPEIPGRLIVEQTISVTYRMSLVGFSLGTSHQHNHDASNHIGAGNTLSAADLTYGIGVGVATNGQSTVLAIGGAFAGTVATTNITQAVATSSGQGLGVTYSFSSSLPTPSAGQVVKISQMISVVVNDTMQVSTPSLSKGDHHEKRERPLEQVNASADNKPAAAPLVAVDKATLNAGASLSQKGSDALVSAVILTGSTTIITGIGVTPVTAHAVGVAGGAALTTTPTSASNGAMPAASSSAKTPLEIIQTLSVTAETNIVGPAKPVDNHNTQSSNTTPPSQTVELAATMSQTPSVSQGTSTLPASKAPVVAETKAGGSGTTETHASSSPSASTNPGAVSEATPALSKNEHQPGTEKQGEAPRVSEGIHDKKDEQHAGAENKDEKKKSSESDQAQHQPKEPHTQDQNHDVKKAQQNPESVESVKKSAPKSQDVSAPKSQDVSASPAAAKSTPPSSAPPTPTSPSSAPPTPTSPSTAQASANGAGSAAVTSGALAAGAGAQAQSGAQSSGPSQSTPAQAAAAGSAVAGAGASSTTPSQTAATNGVSLASTGATLQKSP